MIYTASYFEAENHHGRVISISRSTPKGIAVDGALPFLAPPANLLADWNNLKAAGNPMTWEEYTGRYRLRFARVLPEFKEWLATTTPAHDVTLCCWERAGENCHRNLVGAAIQKFAPDLWGGADVPRVEPLPLFTGANPQPEPDHHSGASTCGLESSGITPGTTVIVKARDWFTDKPFTFQGVVESPRWDGYMVTSKDPRSLYGYFGKGNVTALR